MPRISIIMSVYNAERSLAAAIDSILAQTCQDWEFVICDDASTDQSWQILQKYRASQPDKFVLLQNQENRRLAYSLNRCLQLAKGDYIARMDADDLSHPERLEKQLAFLQANPEFVLCGTAMQRFADDGSLGAIDPCCPYPDYYEPHRSNVFNHATILTHKWVYEQLGGYTVSPRTVRGQDRDLWFRFLKAGLRGANMPDALYLVREDLAAIRRRTLRDYWISYQNSIYGYRLLGYPWHWYLKPTLNLLKGLLPYQAVLAYRKMQAKKQNKHPI